MLTKWGFHTLPREWALSIGFLNDLFYGRSYIVGRHSSEFGLRTVSRSPWLELI
jgi:hypothetical protein